MKYDDGTEAALKSMVGCVFTSVKESKNKEDLDFHGTKNFSMYHDQDCCEHVYLEDISGDLEDLVGTPILEATVETNSDGKPLPESDSEFTWTFYKFRTSKGYVTLRWYGSSNGYYSEEVTIKEMA